ncbi:hypothetical protein [Rhodovibrio salinarum]|uniref:VPLPA-CTERM protein sorting domain-containing protein n=1 Tax=Rhodovibrio salinarum TaxID=1087 RepID=A0A934V1Z7_9PROT|nr:hypothetical protein [Rhodovibrio salinarum]MBK1698891.1 hypothetical protein [Rhodovibrio salinarum]
MFKRKTLTGVFAALAIGAVMSVHGEAKAGPVMSFNLSNAVDQEVVFSPGGSFRFEDETGGNDDFQITGQTGGTGGLLGLFGDLDGTFTFADPAGASSVAVATSGGEFTVNDGTDVLTADMVIFTLEELGGPFGGVLGEILFTSTTYAGSNADLLDIASRIDSPLSISFQVGTGVELDDLFNSGGSFSYSGTVMLVPVPATVAIFGLGLFGLGLASRRFSRA